MFLRTIFRMCSMRALGDCITNDAISIKIIDNTLSIEITQLDVHFNITILSI